jgi:hypothetical protein
MDAKAEASNVRHIILDLPVSAAFMCILQPVFCPYHNTGIAD